MKELPKLCGEILEIYKSMVSSVTEEDEKRIHQELKNQELEKTRTLHFEMLKNSGFPKRYCRAVSSWMCTEQENTFSACKDFCVADGSNVVLTGSKGTGKTTIASQIALEFKGKRKRVSYHLFNDLIGKFKYLYDDMGTIHSDTLNQDRDKILSRDFVIIDEIHECLGNKMSEKILFDFLSRRYSNELSTLLISNEKPEEFEKNHGNIMCRIHETGGIFHANWANLRIK